MKQVSSQSNFTPVEFNPFEGAELLFTAPATESQQEIWLSAQMGEESSCAFNESMSIHLRGGELLLDKLQFAVDELVQRHEALRTTFSTNGELLCINAPQAMDIPLLDVTEEDEETRALQLAQLIKTEVMVPFDLEHGPLLRVKAIKLEKHTYRILFTAHHIVADGWSIAILLRELTILYTAAVKGHFPQLDSPYPFSAYALTQKEKTHSPENQAAEAYWLKQFDDDIPVLDMPTDRPRPSIRTFDAWRIDYELDSALISDLKRTGARASSTFFTTLLGAFAAYVSRLSSQDDFVIGVPAAGQSITGQNNLVGHCVNMLPLRLKVNLQQSFHDLLRLMRPQVLDAYDHQEYTFGSLVKKLPIPRDTSRVPLVSVTFNIDQEMHELAFGELEAKYSSNPRYYENFEIFLNAVEAKGKVILECAYNTNLFDEETIRTRLAEFEVFLRSLVKSPTTPMYELSLLTDTAHDQLLRGWNSTHKDYPHTQCIHQLVTAQAEHTPNAIAITFDTKALSYADLEKRSNQLAQYLRHNGVGPDVLVGIFIERSVEMVVGLLGILKAGGAYVPLDPNFPHERLAFMVEDAGLRVLLTQSSLRASLPSTKARVVALDEQWEAIAKEQDVTPNSGVKPMDLAYVIYTSGSTGKPKGVQVPHRAAVNFLNSMAREPGITPQDSLLAVTTLSFDISVLELFLPLTVGGQVRVVSREVAADGGRLLEELKNSEATIMQATPATWRMLLAAGWEQSHSVKVLCGGEALPRELADELLLRASSVWNMYGPTETTVWSTFCRVLDKGSTVPVGRPINNTTIYILDKNRQPVPIGVPGELYIGGTGVTRGYLNRPELSAERFVPDPFSDENGARLYRTGDLVRYRADGNIEYLNRLDNQVKVRGYRIELGEIETVLAKHEAIKQAVVVVREDQSGDQRLVAYYIAEPNHSVTVAELRKHLRNELPDYMIPQHFVELEAFPMTPNRKIDRRALPSPAHEGKPLGSEYIAPRTETESLVARVWQEILRVERVSLHDNFFELGGHSLSATQTLSRLRDVIGAEITLTAIFEAPTVNELAEYIDVYSAVKDGALPKSGDSEEEREEYAF
jgi:amino acid adenylation domain-containing protein